MSGDTFRIGEIAIVTGDVHPRFVGEEVTIIGELRSWWAFDRYIGEERLCTGYKVSHPAWREVGIVEPRFLRKKRPPLDPAFVKFRDRLVREFAMRPPVHETFRDDVHPSITSMLELVGQGERP